MSVQRQRIIIRLFGEKKASGSVSAYTMDFHNALYQQRVVAFDGQRWFYQYSRRASFIQIGESEVPESVKRAMDRGIVELHTKV
jgi:hypothetical protein